MAGELACASTAALLMQLLRITPGEAKARVRAAEDLGTRRTLTGQQLRPVFPAVAGALHLPTAVRIALEAARLARLP